MISDWECDNEETAFVSRRERFKGNLDLMSKKCWTCTNLVKFCNRPCSSVSAETVCKFPNVSLSLSATSVENGL